MDSVMRRRTHVVGLVLLAASCASVEVRKVGENENPEGLRFYMPRPYVAVNEPFVVSGEAYLVGGQVSPDGRYILVDDIDQTKAKDSAFLGRFLASTGRKIEATTVVPVPAPDAADGGPRGREQAAREGEEDGEVEVERTEKTGVLDLKVTNDNSAFAITPLKRYFDIVWLPDFDEQYVVRGKAGMGNASIGLQLGQGWSLQGLEATVDNSALTERVYRLIDEGSRILSTLGRASVGLPPVPGGEQGANEPVPEGALRFSGGTPVTVKVTFVRVAAPGLYPILKPKELAEAKTPSAEVQRRLLVPVAPYTNIAFNTYEAVVVEAALATGDSALRLHQYVDLRPGTGTAADTRRPEFWREVSNKVGEETERNVTVNPKIDGKELSVVIRGVPEADRQEAEIEVLEALDRMLRDRAPEWNLPADVVFR